MTQKWPEMTVFHPKIRHFKKNTLYVDSRPAYPPVNFRTLFPDRLFPPDSEDTRLCAEQARDLQEEMLNFF